MKVLVIGKAPPLQGGVAVRTFSFVRRLAELGHTVTYVTNSEVASSNYLVAFDASDDNYRKAALAGVKFLSLSKAEGASHIPLSTDFETRLMGLAASDARDADLIVGWYFQPYGVVAAVLAAIHKKPCAVVHAGSDLGRLSLIPEFQSAYQAVFQNCTFVAIRRRNVALIAERLAVPREQIITSRGGRMLPSYFHEHIRKMTLAQLKTLTRERFENTQIDPDLSRWATGLNQKPLNADISVLGVYGKAGEQKGHHELIAALTRLAEAGQQFHLLICTGGHRRNIERLMLLVRQSEALSSRTFWFPFIAPWRIPGFIKLCDAVAFLERGFEIDFHGPQVPKEVLWCGRALVCSREITDKQSFKDSLIDMHNFIDAGDPRDVDQLTRVLQGVLSDKEKLRAIGFAGALLLKQLRNEPAESDGVVAALRFRGLLPAHI